MSNPSLTQSSYCSVTAGRRAARKGRDFWLESISLTPETSGSSFCQKAKNIRKRTFLCVADVVGEVGSVLSQSGGHGHWKRKREGCLFPLTVCRDTSVHVSGCLCVEFFFLTPQVAFYNLCHFCGKVGRSQVAALWLKRSCHRAPFKDLSIAIPCGCGGEQISLFISCENRLKFLHPMSCFLLFFSSSLLCSKNDPTSNGLY